jgi:hypothetical protein
MPDSSNKPELFSEDESTMKYELLTENMIHSSNICECISHDDKIKILSNMAVKIE